MSAIGWVALLVCLLMAPAIIWIAIALLAAKKQTRDVRVERDQATVAFKSLHERATAKLAKAARVVEHWQSRYNRLAHWESTQNHFETTAELQSTVVGLERTVEALRNVIEGYGAKYIVPPYSILDQLAGETAYKVAGERLKDARAHTKQLAKDGEAATSDNADPQGRRLASSLALDAFNCKSDAILIDAKSDNIGTLIQKLKDAFHLVNEQGAIHENARITKEYLQARVAELRCVATARLIKQAERDEQKVIKARMKEEAVVQREAAQLAKEAKRKEDQAEEERALIKQAQEAAVIQERARAEAQLREDLKRVSEAQRAEFEARAQEQIELQVAAKSAEFMAQLSEKETMIQKMKEQGHRAVSMAQLRKSGTVYIISNVGSFGEGVFKIGQTRRLDPVERIDELGDASVPFDFDVHAMIRTEDAVELEASLHERFTLNQVNKMNWRKEFFRVSLLEIKLATEELNISTEWSMVAAAQQFYETQKLEESFAAEPALRDAWLKDQLGVASAGCRELLVGDIAGVEGEEEASN